MQSIWNIALLLPWGVEFGEFTHRNRLYGGILVMDSRPYQKCIACFFCVVLILCCIVFFFFALSCSSQNWFVYSLLCYASLYYCSCRLNCVELHCRALHCALWSFSVHCIILHWTLMLRITLHCIFWHYFSVYISVSFVELNDVFTLTCIAWKDTACFNLTYCSGGNLNFCCALPSLLLCGAVNFPFYLFNAEYYVDVVGCF
jgi:hypothetical protein